MDPNGRRYGTTRSDSSGQLRLILPVRLLESRSNPLSDAMKTGVEMMNTIKAQQDAGTWKPLGAEQPAGPATPRVDKPTEEPGEELPYKEQPPTAGHRPDQFGGMPPVRVGAPDPTHPEQFKGVPQWEEGRQPHQIFDTNDETQDVNDPAFAKSQRQRKSKRSLRRIQNPRRRSDT